MEIGDYARTKAGDLGKVIYIGYYSIIQINEDTSINVLEEDILISSKDLFNVLFPGDYINGREGGRIKEKVTDQNGKYFLVGHTGLYYPEKITQVVTMEKKKKIEEVKKELKKKNKELKELKQAAKDFEKNSIYIL